MSNVTEAARYESILIGLDNTTNSSNEDSKLILTNLMKNFVQNSNSKVEENVTILSKREKLDQLIKQLNQFQEPANRESKLEEPAFTNYYPDYGDPPSDLKTILSKEYSSYNFSDFSDPYRLSTFRTPLETFEEEDAVSPLPKNDEVYLSQDSILANDVQRLALPLVGIATTKNGGQLDPERLQAGAETINIVVSPNFGEDDEDNGNGVAIFPQSEMSRLRSNITNLTGLDIDRLVEEVSAVVGKIDSPLRVEELHTQITRQEGRPPMFKYTETTAQVVPTDDARNPTIEILSKKVKDGEIDTREDFSNTNGISSREVSSDDLKVNVTTKTNIDNIFTFNILVANSSDDHLNLSRVKPYKTKIETTANVDAGSGHNTVSVYKYQAEDADADSTPKKQTAGPATPELEKWLKILLKHQVSGSKEDGNLIQEAVLRDASLLQIPGDTSFNHRGTFYRNVESNTTDNLNQQQSISSSTTPIITTTESSNIGPLGYYVNSGDSQSPGPLSEVQKFVESMGIGAIPTFFVGALATYTLLTGRKKRDLSFVEDPFRRDLNLLDFRFRNGRSGAGTGTVRKIYHASDKEKNSNSKVDIPEHWLAYLLGTKHTSVIGQTPQPVTVASLPRDGRDTTSDTATSTPLGSFSKQVVPSSTTLTTIRGPTEGSNSYQITKLKSTLTTSPMPYTLGQNTLMDKWHEMLKPKSTTKTLPDELPGVTSAPEWLLKNESTSEPLVIGSDVAVSVSTVTEINFVPGKNAPFYSGIKSTEVPPSVWLTAQDIFSGLGQSILPNETVDEINPIFFNNKNGLGVTIIESEETEGSKQPSQSKLLIESFLSRMNSSDSEEDSSEATVIYPVTQQPLKPFIITGNKPSLVENPIPGEVVINSGVIKTKITPNVASSIIRNSQDLPVRPEINDVSDNKELGGLENLVNLFTSPLKSVDRKSSLEDVSDFKMKITSAEAENSGLKEKSQNILESFLNLNQQKIVTQPSTEDTTVDPVAFLPSYSDSIDALKLAIPSYSDTTDVLKLAYRGTQDLFDSEESNHDLAIDKLIEQLEREYNNSASKDDIQTGGQSQLTNKMNLPDELVDSFPNSPWVFTPSEMQKPQPEYIELSPATSNKEILELIKNLERDVTQPEMSQHTEEALAPDLQTTDLETLFSFERSDHVIERQESQFQEDTTIPDVDGFEKSADGLETATTTPGFTTETSSGATVIPQPLFAHLDLRDIADQTTSTTTVSSTTELVTTQSPSAVDILKNILSKSAAPLAGLSAASLAYGAAALLPLWLPLALGKKKKRKRRDFERHPLEKKFFYFK